MTALELCEHPDFAAFCFLWENQGECPLVFADWLRDRGFDAFADAAEWCATEPHRAGYFGDGGGIRPYPGGGAWSCMTDSLTNCRSSIPRDVYLAVSGLNRTTVTVPCRVAVAILFDAWAVARPAALPA